MSFPLPELLPPQQIRRLFRSFLRAYLPTPAVPTSPVMQQELQPVIQLDDVQGLGAKIQPRSQYGHIVAPADGAGRHTGIVLYPGRDGLYLDTFELSAAKTMRIFLVGAETSPTGWAPATGFGDFYGYNPADPLDPPVHSGLGINEGAGPGIADTYMVEGTIATANIPNFALTILTQPDIPWPRNGVRFYIPPDRLMVLVAASANAAININVQVTDPSFITGANL